MSENIDSGGGTKHVMMQLGGEDGFQFSVNTAAYKTLRRQSKYNWAAQARIGSSPALQYTGPGQETINIAGVIYPHYKGGLKQLSQLRKMAVKGEPYILQDVRGESWGKWCIKTVQETQSAYLPGGIPRKIEFSMSLEKY